MRMPTINLKSVKILVGELVLKLPYCYLTILIVESLIL